MVKGLTGQQMGHQVEVALRVLRHNLQSMQLRFHVSEKSASIFFRRDGCSTARNSPSWSYLKAIIVLL